jgi:hypothetical protein
MWMGGQCDAPATLPQERALVPIVEEVGWDPGRVWTNTEMIKSLPPPGFKLQTIQAVAIYYINYNNAAPIISALFLERLKFNIALRK